METNALPVPFRFVRWLVLVSMLLLFPFRAVAEQIEIGPHNESDFLIWVRETSLERKSHAPMIRFCINIPLKYKNDTFDSATLIVNGDQGQAIARVPLRMRAGEDVLLCDVSLARTWAIRAQCDLEYIANDRQSTHMSIALGRYMENMPYQSHLDAIRESPMRTQKGASDALSRMQECLDRGDWQSGCEWLEFMLLLEDKNNKKYRDPLVCLLARCRPYLKTESAGETSKSRRGSSSHAVATVNREIDRFNKESEDSVLIEPITRRAYRVEYFSRIGRAVCVDTEDCFLMVLDRQRDGKFRGRLISSGITPDGKPAMVIEELQLDADLFEDSKRSGKPEDTHNRRKVKARCADPEDLDNRDGGK